MAKQTIGIGGAANDGTGDTLRDAFDKVNDNFTESYQLANDAQTDADTAQSTANSAGSAASTADAKAVAAQADIDTHEANTSNPHSVTKSQVGLGSVPNLAFSGTNTGDQDISGISTNATAIATHSARTDNPHGVTKTQVGLSNVPNLSFSGSNTGDQDLSTYSAHVANTSNPHSVTKTQVGLGSVDNTTDAGKPVSTAQAAALALKLDKDPTLNTQTANYTFAIGDTDVLSNSASAIVFTVPTNTNVAIPVGRKINLTRYGAGTLTVAAFDGTVTVRNNGSLSIDTQYGAAVLEKIATNEWILYNGAPALTWTTFTPTTTGWTSTTENYGAYIIEGKRCTLHLRIITTTTQGAGTTATITNLPALPKSSDPIPIIVINNATAGAGRIDLSAGSATATFYATAAAGAWTTATPRYVIASIVYEIQ